MAGPDGPRLLEERAGFRARRGVYRVIVFTGVAAADAHPDAVHDDVWLDAVDVRALDLPQARGPVHGPVVLTVVLFLLVYTPYAPREREPYGALGMSLRWSDEGGPLASGLQGPSRLGAEHGSRRGHHHGRVVALEGDAGTQSERVAHGDLRFARRAHRDLGSRTSKDLCARKASSRAFGRVSSLRVL